MILKLEREIKYTKLWIKKSKKQKSKTKPKQNKPVD